MRFCMQCGNQNDDESLFCTSCGQRMEAPLPAAQPVPDISAGDVQPVPAHAASPMPAWESALSVSAQASEPAHAAPPSAAVPEQMVQATMELFAAPADMIEDTVVLAEAEKEPVSAPEPEAQPLDEEPEPEPEPEPEAAADGEPDEIAARLADIEDALQSLSSRFDEKISRNEHEAAVLKNMSEEMQEYRDGLYAKLTTPLIRDLVEVREALGSALERNAQEPDADRLAADVELCRDMVADALARNEVQVVASQEGDEFASFKHKIVGRVHTDDPALQGKVAEVSGASYKLGDQFVAPAMVKVYTTEQVGE